MQQLGYEVKTIQFSDQNSVTEMVNLCQLSIQSPGVVLGFSMGGIVALELIKQSPELVQDLILLSSNSHADLVGKQEIRKQHITLAKSTSIESVIGHYYLPSYFYEITAQNKALILNMAKNLGIKSFEAQFNALSTRTDNLNILTKFVGNLLIISGKNDKLCPPFEQTKMQQASPKAALKFIEHCGHFPLQEQPEKSSQIILAWLSAIKE